MPTPSKLIPCLLLLCVSLYVRAAAPVDTIRKMPFSASRSVNYQVGDFAAYLKEGMALIKADSLDRGIKLLSTGLSYAVAKNDAKRLLNYQMLELINVIEIVASGKLSPQEAKPAKLFIKALFSDEPVNVVKKVLPQVNKAPETTFTKRLKVLLLFNDTDKVTRDLDKLLAEQPDLLSANLLKAGILFNERQPEKAVGYYTKVISLWPQYAFAFYMRANSYEQLQIHNKAINDYNEVLQLFPRHYQSHYERADIYMGASVYREAINGYLNTQQIVKNYNWCNYNLARAYRAIEMPDSAMYYINAHLDSYTRDADGFIVKGEIYYELGDYSQAIDNFTKAITLNPYRSAFYTDRADAYYYSKNIDSAMTDVKKALSMDKNNYYLLDRMGNCYHASGDDQKAIEWYKKAINAKPDYKYTYADMDISLNKLGRYKEGIDMLQKALAIDSAYALANGNMGWNYYCLGEYDASIKYSYKALKYQDDATYAMFNIALATLCKGDIEKAKELYTGFVKVCREKNYNINNGAIEDLNDLVKKGKYAKEATFIIENILKKVD